MQEIYLEGQKFGLMKQEKKRGENDGYLNIWRKADKARKTKNLTRRKKSESKERSTQSDLNGGDSNNK